MGGLAWHGPLAVAGPGVWCLWAALAVLVLPTGRSRDRGIVVLMSLALVTGLVVLRASLRAEGPVVLLAGGWVGAGWPRIGLALGLGAWAAVTSGPGPARLAWGGLAYLMVLPGPWWLGGLAALGLAGVAFRWRSSPARVVAAAAGSALLIALLEGSHP